MSHEHDITFNLASHHDNGTHNVANMALPAAVLFDPSKHTHITPQLAQIHVDCVTIDGTLATFLPDNKGQMSLPKIEEYWQSRISQVSAGSRDIILQFSDDSEDELVGYVSLWMPPSETGPFRGAVEKLLVSPRWRYKGIARRLMARLEGVATEKGRGLLVSPS
jgi:ribosomal protein S18 acetylase RimI-like enzyme